MIAIALNGIELNTAVWVGFIALAGLAADDGIVMASFIHERLRGRGLMTIPELREEVYQAGLKRIRPCVMTTITTLAALLPVLLSTGRGSDVARAMAWPVFGGMLIEPFTTFVVPTIYCGTLELRVRRGLPVGDVAPPQTSLEPLASGPYLPPPGGLVEVSVS
jgi:Cu(I)/Ag(I) efflux system membrane protein CusA/SilA